MIYDQAKGDQGKDAEEFDYELGRLDIFLKKLFQSKAINTTPSSGETAQKPSPDSSEFLEIEESELTYLDPGTMIGRFKILKLIGFGGFGVVYHAVDDESGLNVALKLPRQDRFNSSQVLKRFYREARLASGLKHRSIVGVIETSIEGDHFYIASEFQDGVNLRGWLECHGNSLSMEIVVRWGIDLADALQYAFLNGIVHRDLKPTNILIVEDNYDVSRDGLRDVAGWIPRITDFGLAYSINDPASSVSASGMLIGTPGYMAPEQILNGMNRVDIRADIYALGLIMAELLAGVRIRKSDHMMDFVMHMTKDDPSRDLDVLKYLIPEDLRAILLKAIEIEPENRYQSPGEFQDDLIRFQKGQPTLVRPLSLFDRSARYARRYPYQTSLVAMTALFFLVFIVNQWGHNLELKKNENRMVRMAYNSQMRLGYSELRDKRLESVHEILDETNAMKRVDGSPLKDLSWKYLHRMARSQLTTHRIEKFGEYLPAPIGLIIQATYEKNKEFIANKSVMQGSFYFDGHSVRFEDLDSNLIINDSIFSVFRDSTFLDGFIQYDGVKVKILNSSHKSLLYSPVTKKTFYYSLNQDEKSDPTGPTNGLLSFNASLQNPRISLDGSKITCLVKSEGINSPFYSWVVYNTFTGEMIKTGLQISVQGIATKTFAGPDLSQNGNLAVAYAVDTSTIHIFDTFSRKERYRFVWPYSKDDNHPRSLAIDEVNGRLLVADHQGKVYVLKIGDSKPYSEFQNKLRTIHQVGFFPDGRIYGQWAYSDRIWFWNPTQPESDNEELDHTKEVWSLAFDPLGETLVSTGDDHAVHVWNLKAKTQKVLDFHHSLVSCGRFSPDNNLYAACDFSGSIKIWDSKRWVLLKSIQITDQKLRALNWSPDCRSIVCVGGREIINYDVNSGRIMKYISNGICYDVIFDRSGDEIVVAEQNEKGRLLFLTFPGISLIKELPLNHNPTRVAFSPDGGTIATGYNNGGIAVISSITRKVVKHPQAESTFGAVWSLGFTSDGKSLIASGGDNRLIFYETETWEPLGTVMDHKSRVHAMAFSVDGRKFATGDMSGKIVLREIPD